MIYAQRNTSTFFPGSWISLFLFFLSRTILFICLVVAFRHDLALLHSCGTGSWIAGTLFVFLQAFTVGFLGFTISGSSYFRMRLISRISHWTWFRSAFLDLAIFLGLHPAVGNSRYVLILPFFYFLCWGDVSSSFTFGYISGVIRVGFLCFFLIWAFNHWDFPVTKKKIPWTNCIYLFAFSLNFVLFTVRRGVWGCFAFVLMIPEPWWIDSVRVRTAWLDSLFLENILDLEQTTRLSFISLGHKYWSFIYPQTQLCWGREKKKKKKKEKCGWKQFTHTNWWETRAIRKSLQHTIYDTIRLVYTHNIIIDILHTHTHSHTTVSPYQPHRWNQPRQVVLASQQLESGCVTNYPPWAWMRPNRGASTVHPLTIPRKWLTAAAAENGA